MSLHTPRAGSFSTSVTAAAAFASVSVSVAIWLSLRPHRLTDLVRVAAWGSQWLHGAPLYGAGADVDYPPWAIVTLSPLAAVPTPLLPIVWVVVNLVALATIARRLAPERGAIFFLVLAAGAMRTLNQFSLVSLALALAGTSSSSPLSPLWLGLSLMKPQIGLVFWLQALWQRQWRVAAAAIAVPLLLTGVFAAGAQVSLALVFPAYGQAIEAQYGPGLWGQTEITVWLRPLVPAALAAGAVAILVGLTLARRKPRLGFALASLLAVRHPSYDLVLLLPWLASLGMASAWMVAALLVVDPSAVFARVLPGSWLSLHADRLCVTAVWLFYALPRVGTAAVSGRFERAD